MNGLPRILVAPMAGGPSTPQLVAAAERAGALGFVAAGYLSAPALASQINQVRALGAEQFGVNLFVPEPIAPVDLLAFEQALRAFAATRAALVDIDPGEVNWADDDAYTAKLDLVLDARVPLVSFTFGLPSPDDVERLHAVGSKVMATVTTCAEATAALAVGVDFLCAQGPKAGGHRATHRVVNEAPTLSLSKLVADVAALGAPVVAAGGLMTATHIAEAFEAGAVAAQCGTAFLLADEAGTNPTHRAALTRRSTATLVTRAFSGRPARGLANAWTSALDGQAPAAYPQVNQLTAPLRRAASAAGDADGCHLWAGECYSEARPGSTAEIIARLTAKEGLL